MCKCIMYTYITIMFHNNILILQYINNTVNVTKETPNLVQMRGLVFDLLKGTSLKVILFHQVSSKLIFGSCLILIYAYQKS